MTTVAVTIAGRSYRMACGKGEEPHLQRLARHVDQTLAGLRKSFGEIGDARLVIMTAITLADELFECKRRIDELEASAVEHGASLSDSEAKRDALAAEVAASLDVASKRIESIAQHLDEAWKG